MVCIKEKCKMDDDILNKVIALREKFDTLQASYSNDESFADAITNALAENEMPTVEKIRADYAVTAESERLLKIGIVGAVKAGKSSLLNALFFDGVDILPKAATPMTAALTEISYGETCEVSVDFFTDDDIETLKRNSDIYERELQRLIDEKQKEQETSWLKAKQRKNPEFDTAASDIEKNTWKKNAETMAKRKLDENLSLSGAHEQYQSIKKVNEHRKTESEVFTVDRVSDIAGRLTDYVGSSGKYMPFTSKVTIKLPIRALEGISVIDTPGFNDPVPSRDERARRSLKECDVVLILSPARQFISINDKDVMQKIKTKNGIRELYLIASQVDNQLFNLEITDKVNGDLQKAVTEIKLVLEMVTKKNLADINNENVFADLINETGKRLFTSSGICESMYKTFNERVSWDSGRMKVWDNLKKNYPDYFSDGDLETSRSSLQSLGNIAPIDACIQHVKERKKEIFEQRLADFGNKYRACAKAVKEDLLNYLQQKEKQLQETDIKEIEKEIAATQKFYSVIAPEIDIALEDTVREWYEEVKADYSNNLKIAKDEAKSAVADSEGSYTSTWTTGHLFWKKSHSRTVTTANASQIKSAISDMIDDYNDRMPHFVESEIYRLSKKLSLAVQKTWAENNPNSAESLLEVRNKARSIIVGLNLEYKLDYTGPQFSAESGNISGYSAEKLLGEANEFVSDVHGKFKKMLNDALNDVLQRCKKCNFSRQVLDSYLTKLEQRKKDLEQPKLAMENIKRIRDNLTAIVSDV